jgi:hypothetical protein
MSSTPVRRRRIEEWATPQLGPPPTRPRAETTCSRRHASTSTCTGRRSGRSGAPHHLAIRVWRSPSSGGRIPVRTPWPPSERVGELRRIARRRGCLVPGPARLDRRAHRPIRFRQEHAAPLPEPPERSRARLPCRGQRVVPRRRSLRTGRRPGRGAHAHRPRLPATQPVPEVDLRQRRVRAPDARVPRRHR